MLIGLTEEFMNFAELTKKLLKWNKNKDLTTERDANGSTPLHFAAGLWGAGNRGSACTQVFDAATSVLYLPDNDGLSPVHVAAAAKASGAIFSPKIPIAKFVSKCPSSAGLRDAKGRTFLHVAVEKKNVRVVRYACGDPSLAWIMNMQDNQGNTALHLAVKHGSLDIFRLLFGNGQVNLNLTNENGQTPLDIATYNVRSSFCDGTVICSSSPRSIALVKHDGCLTEGGGATNAFFNLFLFLFLRRTLKCGYTGLSNSPGLEEVRLARIILMKTMKIVTE